MSGGWAGGELSDVFPVRLRGLVMPELPEVETMVRGLRPVLAGRRLCALLVQDPFLLQGCDAGAFTARVLGARVEEVERRGKWVVIALGEHRGLIVIQPRMTGGFWLVPPERPDHVRLTFHVEGREEPVWYCDNRRLGRIAWFPDAEAAGWAFARSHGPDALAIAAADLAARLAKTARAVKPALMDQKLVAGIGNIYADEILFAARIHPQRPARSLSRAESGRIHAAIARVLEAAIAAEGSSFDAGYRTVLGREGGFLAQNAMYGRGGEPCPACGSAIEKTRIAGLIGRPTYFCARCQPARPRRSR
jgi:formamidopyrimidine-DNA glycosylase